MGEGVNKGGERPNYAAVALKMIIKKGADNR